MYLGSDQFNFSFGIPQKTSNGLTLEVKMGIIFKGNGLLALATGTWICRSCQEKYLTVTGRTRAISAHCEFGAAEIARTIR